MGSLFSSSDSYGLSQLLQPAPAPAPAPQPISVVVTPPTPVAPITPPTPVAIPTVKTEPKPPVAETVKQAAEDAAAKRARGIAGTVLTSWRGVAGADSAAPTLDLNTLAPDRKRLLGE